MKLVRFLIVFLINVANDIGKGVSFGEENHPSIAHFIPSFPDMFRLAPSSPDSKNIWPIKKTSQQRDV